MGVDRPLHIRSSGGTGEPSLRGIGVCMAKKVRPFPELPPSYTQEPVQLVCKPTTLDLGFVRTRFSGSRPILDRILLGHIPRRLFGRLLGWMRESLDGLPEKNLNSDVEIGARMATIAHLRQSNVVLYPNLDERSR